MELIPVLDLQHGRAVHARRGAREQYQAVRSALLPHEAGDALGLARAYRRLDAGRCYIADLDAIQGRPAQYALIRQLANPGTGFGPDLMIDAGLAAPEEVEPLLAAGAKTLVAGLESLPGFAELAAIVREAGDHPVVYSLDLMLGKPVRRRTGRIATQEAVALELGARAADAGCRALLVLDLATVGSEAGPRNLDLLDGLKRVIGLPVYTGGGVRSAEDLRTLADIGCDAVLIGTALHAGGITPSEFRPPGPA
jgi:phosphoribosylformimino-5-aminoimidazole carboxamide ribotide isomerase